MSTLIQLDTGTSVSVTETFMVDGVAINVDSGTPILTLTRPDGTAFTPLSTVLTTWTGPPVRATGEYRFVLAAQADPIWLDYTLTGIIGGQPQTLGGRVEWVGQPLYTISQFRALRTSGGQPFLLTATPFISDQQIQDARAATLEEFTRILDYSPVPRFARELHDGGRSWLRVRHTKAGPLLSVKVDGVAQAVSDYTLRPSGLLEGTFASGSQNIAIEYVHGASQIPGDGARQAMLYAAAELNPSVFASGTTVTTPDGVSVTYEPSEMGRSGYQRHTGIRSVDRYLNRWSDVGLVVA